MYQDLNLNLLPRMWGGKTRKKEALMKEDSRFIENNGSALHEELITTFNGRHKVPIHFFSAEELIRATNNFIHPVQRVYDSDFYRGSLEKRPICVRPAKFDRRRDKVIHDIVISSQMSHHKNVWKLLGCCLEFEFPALVYEYDENVGGFDFLGDLLFSSTDDKRRILSWKSRLKIANDIANAVVYLHMAFPTPIIHRDLIVQNVIIDRRGVAKLFDFSVSIALPPGELQVEDYVFGTRGYMDPEYVVSRLVSQKTDVYSFGVLLLLLLTGIKPVLLDHEGLRVTVVDHVNGYVDEERFKEVVDSKICYETEEEQQMQAFVALALTCVQEREDRPEMIEVARRLRRIEKSARPH